MSIIHEIEEAYDARDKRADALDEMEECCTPDEYGCCTCEPTDADMQAFRREQQQERQAAHNDAFLREHLSMPIGRYPHHYTGKPF